MSTHGPERQAARRRSGPSRIVNPYPREQQRVQRMLQREQRQRELEDARTAAQLAERENMKLIVLPRDHTRLMPSVPLCELDTHTPVYTSHRDMPLMRESPAASETFLGAPLSWESTRCPRCGDWMDEVGDRVQLCIACG